MPNKNVFIKNRIKNKREEGNIFAQLLSQFKLDDSFTNLILGAIVIIVIAIMIIIFVKNNKQEQTSSTTSDSAAEELEDATSSTYTIKVGDSLWSISEKVYKSGYRWTEIAKANNLENPGLIHAGNALKLPSASKEVVAIDVKSDSKTTITEKPISNNAITENKYTIKKGDNLWNIAVRAYGDGFRYVEIAKANNLANPRLIHSDNVLTIPRK